MKVRTLTLLEYYRLSLRWKNQTVAYLNPECTLLVVNVEPVSERHFVVTYQEIYRLADGMPQSSRKVMGPNDILYCPSPDTSEGGWGRTTAPTASTPAFRPPRPRGRGLWARLQQVGCILGIIGLGLVGACAGLLILAAILDAGSGRARLNTDTVPSVARQPTSTAMPTPTPIPAVAPLAEGAVAIAPNGSYGVRLVRIVDPYTPGSILRPARNFRYVAFHLAFKAWEQGKVRVWWTGLKAFDQTRRQYEPQTAPAPEPQLGIIILEPGAHTDGWVVFEVPVGTSISELQYTSPLSFSPERETVRFRAGD